MLDRLLEFNEALRDSGVPVAVSESMDALRSLEHVPVDQRESFKAALAAAMIKSQGHRRSFDVLFDLYFPVGTGHSGDDPAGEAGPSADADVEAFIAELLEALQAGDGNGIGAMAVRAVDAFGRVENSPSDSLFFEYPVFRTIDTRRLLERLLADDDAGNAMEARLRRDEFAARVGRFRDEVRREVRRRVAERRGPRAVAAYSVRPLLEDLDLATASTEELAELRRAIRPLARKLATRIALKRRRGQRGRLDVRRTVRHSLSTGGVPFDTFYRKKTPHRPELFVLCDVSDSVARFARFSLMLVHSLQSQFSRVRSFAFVDTIDEVTHLFEEEDFSAAVERMNAEAEVVWIDRNSNYGSALDRFHECYAQDVGPKATVLILGDARSNNRAPRADRLKELSADAHRTYWLNPESVAFWDTGDSVASTYAAFVDRMVEVRTLKQLEDFIAEVL